MMDRQPLHVTGFSKELNLMFALSKVPTWQKRIWKK